MQSPVLPSYYSLLRRSLGLRLLVSLGEFFDRFSCFLVLFDSVQWLLLTIFLHKQELVCLEDVYAIYQYRSLLLHLIKSVCLEDFFLLDEFLDLLSPKLKKIFIIFFLFGNPVLIIFGNLFLRILVISYIKIIVFSQLFQIVIVIESVRHLTVVADHTSIKFTNFSAIYIQTHDSKIIGQCEQLIITRKELLRRTGFVEIIIS